MRFEKSLSFENGICVLVLLVRGNVRVNLWWCGIVM